MPDRSSHFEMAREFHRALELPVGDAPAPLTDDRLRLRLTLLAEEVTELVCAMCGLGPSHTRWVADRVKRIFRRGRVAKESDRG